MHGPPYGTEAGQIWSRLNHHCGTGPTQSALLYSPCSLPSQQHLQDLKSLGRGCWRVMLPEAVSAGLHAPPDIGTLLCAGVLEARVRREACPALP